MQTKEYADLPPPDEKTLVRGGLAGTGHIVCRAIIAKIVGLCSEKGAWSPFSYKEIKARCPESPQVVSRFLGELTASGRLCYSVEMAKYIPTPAFIQDCVAAARTDLRMESGW